MLDSNIGCTSYLSTTLHILTLVWYIQLRIFYYKHLPCYASLITLLITCFIFSSLPHIQLNINISCNESYFYVHCKTSLDVLHFLHLDILSYQLFMFRITLNIFIFRYMPHLLVTNLTSLDLKFFFHWLYFTGIIPWLAEGILSFRATFMFSLPVAILSLTSYSFCCLPYLLRAFIWSWTMPYIPTICLVSSIHTIPATYNI